MTIEDEYVTAGTTEITESDADEATELTVAEARVADAAEAADEDEDASELAAPAITRSTDWSRLLAYIVLPVLAVLLAAGAGYLGWRDYNARAADAARIETLQVAKDATIKLLSYQPDTVEQQLTAAQELLTGKALDSYKQVTTDMVIPGAKEQRIAAIANVPAVASVSAARNQAVALVFVNQSVTVGDGAPTSTNSTVRVTMTKDGDRWLISEFDPV